MRVVPAVIAAVGVAAVAAAVIVVSQGGSVKNAGEIVGYSQAPTARSIAVLGDSYSSGNPDGGSDSWPSIVAGLDQLQLLNDSIAGTGYVAHSNDSTSQNNAFPSRVDEVVKQNPSIVIVWGAHDDLGDGKKYNPSLIADAMKHTLTTLQARLPHAKFLVIGPTWINERIPGPYNALNLLETRAASIANVPYLQTLGPQSWFHGNYAGLIGQNQYPTSDGNQHIAALVQQKLLRLKFVRDEPQASDAVPPVLPTVTNTFTPPAKTVTAKVTITATPTATPTVTQTVTAVPTATVTVLAPP